MKSKFLAALSVCSLMALAAWYVQTRDGNGARGILQPANAADETINRALQYLVTHQREGGHWEADGGRHPVALTSLATIALLMEPGKQHGTIVFGHKYPASIRKAIAWLMGKSNRQTGLIFSEHPSEVDHYMEAHGLATLVLAGVYRNKDLIAGPRDDLKDTLMRAADYIVRSQSSLGGWYHTSRLEGHDLEAVVPTAIQLQALEAADYAAIPFPRTVDRSGGEYLKAALSKLEKNGPLTSSQVIEAAAALACFPVPEEGVKEFFGGERDFPLKCLKLCSGKIPVGRDIEFGRDELVHYFYAKGLFASGQEEVQWKEYRKAMFDHLIASQNKDGSWPAADNSYDGIGAGPVYSTAIWSIVLLVEKGGHPLQPIVLKVD